MRADYGSYFIITYRQTDTPLNRNKEKKRNKRKRQTQLKPNTTNDLSTKERKRSSVKGSYINKNAPLLNSRNNVKCAIVSFLGFQ